MSASWAVQAFNALCFPKSLHCHEEYMPTDLTSLLRVRDGIIKMFAVLALRIMQNKWK